MPYSPDKLALYSHYPVEADCKAGLWCLLQNGYLVGPLMRRDETCEAVRVQFDANGGGWTLHTIDEWADPIYAHDDFFPSNPRLITRVGTRKELMQSYLAECALAAEIVAELIAES